eukprot:352963-Chlamydomonas_euryale.AAC.1
MASEETFLRAGRSGSSGPHHPHHPHHPYLCNLVGHRQQWVQLASHLAQLLMDGVWSGAGWCGAVQAGVERCRVVWSGAGWCGAVQGVWSGAGWCGAVQGGVE